MQHGEPGHDAVEMQAGAGQPAAGKRWSRCSWCARRSVGACMDSTSRTTEGSAAGAAEAGTCAGIVPACASRRAGLDLGKPLPWHRRERLVALSHSRQAAGGGRRAAGGGLCTPASTAAPSPPKYVAPAPKSLTPRRPSSRSAALEATRVVWNCPIVQRGQKCALSGVSISRPPREAWPAGLGPSLSTEDEPTATSRQDCARPFSQDGQVRSRAHRAQPRVRGLRLAPELARARPARCGQAARRPGGPKVTARRARHRRSPPAPA